MARSNLEKTLSTLGVLTRPELLKLREIIDDLLEIEDESDQAADSGANGKVKSVARGHIELKLIRGYGPYKYLRRWEGKKLTSTYLGKAW